LAYQEATGDAAVGSMYPPVKLFRKAHWVGFDGYGQKIISK
jgi:hypothetical protein